MGFLKSKKSLMSKKSKKNFQSGIIYGAGLSVGMYVAEKAVSIIETIPEAAKKITEKKPEKDS